MATDDISVSIGIQGESKFKKALAECQNTVKQLDSALKANAAEYEANADALGENVERTKLLSKSIELQKKMAEGLGDAIEHATKEYGAASRQTTQYVVAQNKAKEAVAKLEKELKESDRELEELGRDSVRVGRQLEQGIGEGAEDAARKLDDVAELLDSVEAIENLERLKIGVDIMGGVMEGITGIVQGSEEFSRQMSYINQNAKEAGISTETIGKYMAFATSAIGDFDQAAEGLNNLMGAKLDAKELADAMNLLLGAAIDIPETFTFPALAEGLRETLQQKAAVGQFADLLSYLNVDLENFNEAMSKTSDAEHAQDVLLGFVANRGLEETLSGWAKDNQDMIDAKTAAFELDLAMSDLATSLTDVSTAWTSLKTSATQAISSVLKNTDLDEWIIEKINNIKELADMINIWADDEKLKEFAEGKKQERKNMIESGEAETEGEALLRQMGKPEWYINWYREKAKKQAEEVGKGTGETTIEGITTSLEEGTPEAEAGAQTLMDKLKSIFGESIIPDWVSALESQINGMGDLMNRAPRKLPSGWNVGGGIAPEATNPMIVSFKFSEKTFASATFPTINEMLGREINVNV